MSTSTRPSAPAGTTRSAETIFYEAVELPEDERESFLEKACGADASLRTEVEGFLHHLNRAGTFLKEEESPGPELEAEFARLRPEEAGDRIRLYKLLEQIGEGGFGRVWVAEQERPIRRRVALKIIKLGMDTREVVARFEQERQALAMMEHPNIAKVFDAGATQWGRPYFVMELVRGVKITDYCDQAQLTTTERLKLFIQVCSAVQHAHQKGIIHRDLKPSNVLVTLHDGLPVPKVIDFGIAKATQQQRLTDLTIYTQFEQMIGTPLYMAPEQAEMSGLDVDTRSDIYSLGVLLYELLTGRTPFDPEQLMKAGFDEMRRVIREEEPQKPSTFVSTMAAERRATVAKQRNAQQAKLAHSIRGDLDWIVMKALEKDRNRRYETANGLAKDIERHLTDEPVNARPPSAGYRFRRFVRRHRVAASAIGVCAAALLLGAAVSTWQAIRANDAAMRTNLALESLRSAAPSFAAEAQNLISRREYNSALGKLSDAVNLRPDFAEYRLRKADVLESQFRFTEAAATYREALQILPQHSRAELNAALCDKLARELSSTGKLSRQSLTELFERMTKEERSAAELMKVGELLGEEKRLILGYWAERLKDLPIPPDRTIRDRLSLSESGLLELDLRGTGLSDISSLSGMPLERLDLSGCKALTDLTPLRGMPLKHLFLGANDGNLTPHASQACAVRDLSALRGLALVTLDIFKMHVADLSPLLGMPLERLEVRETEITNLAPLRGMPLRYLDCSNNIIDDFSAVSQSPIEDLNVSSTRVADLSFLQKLPLRALNLSACHFARGFNVLSQLPTLQSIVLPGGIANFPEEDMEAIVALRQHPGLRNVWGGGATAERVSTLEVFPWDKLDRDIQVRRLLMKLTGDRRRFRKLAETWQVFLDDMPISNVRSLSIAPISLLSLKNTQVRDLESVASLGASVLYLSGTKVRDLRPLVQLNPKVLHLDNCPRDLDLSPLAEMTRLTDLLLPPKPRNLEALRGCTNLRRVSFFLDPGSRALTETSREFWKRIDADSAEKLARAGRMKEAEQLLRAASEKRDLRSKLARAATLVAINDSAGYRHLCEQLLQEYNAVYDPESAASVVRICSLGTNGGIFNDLDLRLSAAEPIQGVNPDPWFEVAKGLWHLRGERAERAIDSFLNVIDEADAEEIAASSATAMAGLAIAYQELGKRAEGTAWIQRANAAILPNWPAGGLSPTDWYDWFLARLLVDEAVELIRPQSHGRRPK